MSVDLFDSLKPPIVRNQYGHPQVIPADGGKPEWYVRVSTFKEAMSEAGGLIKYVSRYTALGIAKNEDLAAIAAGLEYGDPKLDEVIEAAKDRVGGSAKANWGTAIHRYTEPDAPAPPERMAADVAAYNAELARHGATVLTSDRFVVNDALKLAGTFDDILAFAHVGNRLSDKKTGRLHPLDDAIQLAVYAGGVFYDLDADGNPVRTPLPDVDQDTGIIAHVPAGKGECVLYAVDLNLGRAAAELALDVREWRKRKDLAVVLEPGVPAAPVDRRAERHAMLDEIAAEEESIEAAFDRAREREGTRGEGTVSLDDLIVGATSLEHLHGLWSAHQVVWTAEHSELAKARKAAILGGIA